MTKQVAMTIDGVQDNKVMIHATFINDYFMFADVFRRTCQHHIKGVDYEFFVQENCTSGLTRKQVIDLCALMIDRNMVTTVEDTGYE